MGNPHYSNGDDQTLHKCPGTPYPMQLSILRNFLKCFTSTLQQIKVYELLCYKMKAKKGLGIQNENGCVDFVFLEIPSGIKHVSSKAWRNVLLP